ncbi:MAG: hypothetical protein HY286_04035 [Planctomycetes bacterium]|nr:hypothetical protein [Planctomycetota bacterium]
MKGNRSLILAACCLAAIFLGACQSTWNAWKTDAAGIVRAQRYHFNHNVQSLERHFLNYDRDDPKYDY